jgi:hypothetical protein
MELLKQVLQPYNIRRIQYSLTLLLPDHLRAFYKEGLPLNMDMILNDLGKLLNLLMKLGNLYSIGIHE